MCGSVARKFMVESIKDPVLLKKMMPDYPIGGIDSDASWGIASLTPFARPGCRRLTFTRPFLEAIHMPHVFVNTDPIVRIEPNGVVTRSKETGQETLTQLDLLVAATGFDVTFITDRMKITGRNGKDLWDSFRPWPKAYRSVTVNGFPNYSFTMGPAAPLAHNSIYHETEQQINVGLYLCRAFAPSITFSIPYPRSTRFLFIPSFHCDSSSFLSSSLRFPVIQYALQMIVRWQCDPTILSYEVKNEAVEAFNDDAQKFLQNTVWINSCGGWYNDRERNYLLQWPGSGMHHMLSLMSPEYEDYVVERAGAKL